MRRWFRFSRIEKFVVEAIILIVLVIEGYRFIRFELGFDQAKPQTPKIEQPRIHDQTTESPPTLVFI